jgi:proteic killer suppression protein
VIQSFADVTTKDIYDDVNSKAARRIPKPLWPIVRRKLDALEAATTLRDLAHVPGHYFEALQGDRRGEFSIRVNKQYRVTFRFDHGQAHDVCCEDYH